MRFAPGSPSRVVAELPPGYDLRFTTAVDRPDATRILYWYSLADLRQGSQ
jgi:hypothetical protein